MDIVTKINELEGFTELMRDSLDLLKKEIEKEETVKKKKTKKRIDRESFDLLAKAKARRAKNRIS